MHSMTYVKAGEAVVGNAERMGQEDRPVSECLADDAVLLPATRTDVDGSGQQTRIADFPQPFQQQQIFE